MSSICLISHNSAGALCDGAEGYIGGVERQTGLLAEWLAGRGHDVSVVAWAEYPGQKDEKLGTIKLVRVCARSEGTRILRFIWPRWSSLISALRRINAEILVQNVPESTTGQVGLWARWHDKRFVYMVACDQECERDLPVFDDWQEKVLFAMGLRRADTIIVQTNVQQSKLRNEWGLDSVLARMPCAPPATVNRDRQSGRNGPILWVGRIHPIKRLELLFEAALLGPSFSFQVIGGLDLHSAYERQLDESAKGLNNVEMLGRKTYDEVWQHYEKASILVCTSKYEGFPNTFLEAMYFGIPIVSTFDPDGIIGSKGLGASVVSAQEIVDAIARLKSDAAEYEATSLRCRTYFDEFHQAPNALAHIEKCILGDFRKDE